MKKPKHLIVLKILGVVFACVGVAGIVLTVLGFGNFDNNYFVIGGPMTCIGLFLAFVFIFTGFSPEIAKLSTKTSKYIQEENKQDLTDIATTKADISGEAITKVSKSIKKGFKNTKYCKYCGAEIDADSSFCKECGKKQ